MALIGGNLLFTHYGRSPEVILASILMDPALQEVLLENEAVVWDKGERVERLASLLRSRGVEVKGLERVELASPYHASKDLFGPKETLKIRIEKGVAFLEVVGGGKADSPPRSGGAEAVTETTAGCSPAEMTSNDFNKRARMPPSFSKPVRQKAAALCLAFLLLPLLVSALAQGAEGERRIIRAGNPAVQPAKVGEYWALIIGIDRYVHIRPQLETAVSDGKAVADVLVHRFGFSPERILTLYDADATRENIIDRLTHLIKHAKPADLVLVYYAGHGELWLKGQGSFEIHDPGSIRRMKQYGIGFWVPVDAHPGKTHEYLANSNLRTYLSQLDIKHLLLISDSCYAGGLVQRSFDPDYRDPVLEEALSLRSRLLIASGGLHPVPDRSRLAHCAGHSTFACYLLKSLQQDPSRPLMARRLFNRLYEPVVSNSLQEPMMAVMQELGHEGGQFVVFRLQRSA